MIHFGQDGGKEHDGMLYLAFNTIVTPFSSPVVELSAPKVKTNFIGNLISDGGSRQNNQALVGNRAGALLQNVTGSYNWFSGGFSRNNDTQLDPVTNVFQQADFPLFINAAKHDYHLTPKAILAATSRLSRNAVHLPEVPGMSRNENEPPLAWQYRYPASKERRPVEQRLTLGAYARSQNAE